MPQRGHLAIERIEFTKLHICGYCPNQRLVTPLSQPARAPGKGHQQITLEPSLGSLAQDMQPVPDLRFFQLADIGVEFLQGSRLVVQIHDA